MPEKFGKFMRTSLLPLAIGLSALFSGCSRMAEESRADLDQGPISQDDLLEIQRRGKLVALCRYNATGYFIYKGRPMGFEYELLKKLADELKVELEIIVPRTWPELYGHLKDGTGDIIAAGLAVTKEHSSMLMFTEPHSTTRQMLVQRKPDNWRDIPVHKLNQILIRNPIDLIGKSVHVRMNSPQFHRLKNLSNEIGGDIKIVEAPIGMENEFLIKMVSEGLINYTVAPENIVRGFSNYYGNIDARTAVSFPQRIAWGVRKSSPRLKEAVDGWIQSLKRSPDPYYNVVYNKYFKNRTAFSLRMESAYFSHNSGGISPYDSLFLKYAEPLGWDWKLIAAQAYQESKFDPLAESWAGARGVMQLIPSTARELGVGNILNPDENIRAGVQFLKLLFNYWEDIPDFDNRIKFTLASYNAGQGHVEDARRLARKYGKDPSIWDDNVDFYLLKKSEERFYYDEVVKHGFCRGEEPYNYVKEILERYEIYKKYGEYLELDRPHVNMQKAVFTQM